MKRFINKRKLFIALGLIILAILGYIIIPVSLPIILAFITALLLEPIIAYLSKLLKGKRQLSVVIVFILFICFIALCSYFITTKVITEVIDLVENSPIYVNNLSKMWFKAEAKLVSMASDLPKVVVNQFTSQIQNFLSTIKEGILDYVNINNFKAILTNIPNYLVSFIIYLVSLFLFLIDLPRLTENFYSHLTEKTTKKVKYMTSRLSFIIFNYIKVQFFISIIVFILTLITLHFIAPEIALYMSMLIWLLNFIPIFGTFIILAPWAIFHLLTGNILVGITLLLLALGLVVVKKFVKPYILGGQYGLSPLSTLVVMYLGFKIIGLYGIIIGPLILVIFYSAKEAGIIQINVKI
ncbi:sporulation integral membrane protein YtvI [Bacillus sp. DNRA2]|uniref:sporulation integral membrane protein YtvI n=1 Tax=Bacillus sp. DNRA2 TaxID=2723053 RepID=UPI002006DCF3|nr:sporulation integral membrane protein YtvI [Bacillus sp. DNRA2]